MNPDNARPYVLPRLLARISRGFFCGYPRLPPLKAAYDADAFVPHAVAASGLPHCAKFPHCCLRRSLGRISSPNVAGRSHPATVVGTVGLCPAVYLMGRDPIPAAGAFPGRRRRFRVPGINPLSGAVPGRGAGRSRVTHRSPLHVRPGAVFIVRLACVRHAASVHPEPGSNSPPLKKSGWDPSAIWT